MMLDTMIWSFGGLAIGALVFRGKAFMGYCSGAAGMWKFRGHLENAEWIIIILIHKKYTWKKNQKF